MKVQEAIKNVATVILNARMTGPEHSTLQQNLTLIMQRCERADELEKRFKKELKKKHGDKISKGRTK